MTPVQSGVGSVPKDSVPKDSVPKETPDSILTTLPGLVRSPYTWLVLLSGMAALIYEVLWMKQLGLLFGSSSLAAAATFAAFFFGLALGSAFWGRRAAKMRSPLFAYALLEFGVALGGGFFFVVLPLYRAIYPYVFSVTGPTLSGALVKFLLAFLLVSVPTFFMGGTIPVMGQHVIKDRKAFGRLASFLYGINTFGGAIGGLLAGFYLPLALGYNLTFVLALSLTLCVAIGSLYVFYRSKRNTDVSSVESSRLPQPDKTTPDTNAERMNGLRYGAILVLCFLSGFCVLALEVAWTHMLSQVFQNTVYTFAAILVTILLGLAAGAGIAHLLARQTWRTFRVLFALVMLSGLYVAATPFVFMRMTDGMRVLGGMNSWDGYMFNVFLLTSAVVGLPACVLGTVFPYLMKMSESQWVSSGKTLGDLSAINTAGAILGSLCAGFVLLGLVGIWQTILILGLAYLLVAILLPVSHDELPPAWRLTGIAVMVVCVQAFYATKLPLLLVNEAAGERIVEVWQSASGTVAVTRMPVKGGPDNLMIKHNGHYAMGSSSAAYYERMQTVIPMSLHPQAESVFFLGLGTGITAGEALSDKYKVKRVVSCELVPEVAIAAREYFGPWTNGLFEDERSEVIVEDGRQYLAGTTERFDIICSDLFVPYRSGAGSLYTLEHFEIVRERLRDDGIFVLWLPLYQVTEQEFRIISKTLLETFGQVTVWRSHFAPNEEVAALVARAHAKPLPPSDLTHPVEGLKGMTLDFFARKSPDYHPGAMLLYYVCNLSEIEEEFSEEPLNLDDHPLIEFLAPKSSGMYVRNDVRFVGRRFQEFQAKALELCPPESDPYLVNRTPAQRRLVRAGLNLSTMYLCLQRAVQSEADKKKARLEAARAAFEDFKKQWEGDRPAQPRDPTALPAIPGLR